MAFYLGEADAGLKAALSSFRNPSLDFMNPNFVKQTLDDTRWFLDQIEKCIEAGKKKQTCHLDDEEEERALKNTPEKTKAAYLKELSSFCPE